MNNYFYLLLLVSFFAKAELYAQAHRFNVKTTPFSTDLNDEFSPVFFKGGIVFCSNRMDNSLVSYNDLQNRLFKIFYVTPKGINRWDHPKILAKEITTAFNDGPVTFNEKGNIMYYSRNNNIENSLRNISDTSNKLGIYSAELIDGIWTNIKPFKYNNPLYSLCTPALTPDGGRIYYSSDMPGGKGDMDLYYCTRVNNDWDQPVNMGPVINTSDNESFPFVNKSGYLFFASDGHKGFGGKDLFYTLDIKGEWMDPVHLDSAINSTADDFGLVADSTFESGYFSTNRRKSDDIFSFSSAPIEFSECENLRENNYCYTLYDEHQRLIDSIPVIYQWDFGNGIIRTGKEVKHCFPGPGKYSVKLSIIDELTGNVIAKEVEHNVELENISQAYINSFNIGLIDKSISFEGEISSLKDFRITQYLWNFGEGFKPAGPVQNTAFKKKGDYTIQLGLLSDEDSLGIISRKCFMKKIRVYDSFKELPLKRETGENKDYEKTDSVGKQDKTIQLRIYLMDDLSEKQNVKIMEVLKKYGKFAVGFDKYGIEPDSYSFLEDVVNILKEDPAIRIEADLYSLRNEMQEAQMELSEQWARELAFYFKGKEIDANSFRSKGFDLSHQVFDPFVPESKKVDGLMEFVFLTK